MQTITGIVEKEQNDHYFFESFHPSNLCRQSLDNDMRAEEMLNIFVEAFTKAALQLKIITERVESKQSNIKAGTHKHIHTSLSYNVGFNEEEDDENLVQCQLLVPF